MWSEMKRYVACALVVWLCGGSLAWAGFDCKSIYTSGIDCKTSKGFDAEAVAGCKERGAGPPKSCVTKEKLSETGDDTGLSLSKTDPANPPGALGASPSVDAETIRLSFGYPPWNGAPCKIPGIQQNFCDMLKNFKPKPVPPQNDCSVSHDTAGVFGEKKALLGGTLPAPCGGALPLSNYELTLNRNPEYLIATEEGKYFIWVYKKNGDRYKELKGSPFPMPSYFCGQVDIKSKQLLYVNPLTLQAIGKTVDLTPPIAQMILYNGNAQSIALRLQTREKMNPFANPPPVPPYKPAEEEKYLVIPLKNGLPFAPEPNMVGMAPFPNGIIPPPVVLPANCSAGEEHFALPSTSPADLSFEFEGEKDSAVKVEPPEGAVLAPPALPRECEKVMTYPKGTHNGVVCDGTVQHMGLDRSNMLYPPGSTIAMESIEGRTAVLAAAVPESRVYMKARTTIRLGSTAPAIEFSEGGKLELKDGQQLIMFPPAIVTASTGQVKLPSGGQLIGPGGTLLQEFAPDAVVTPPNAVRPFRVHANRSLMLPKGFMVPTQQAPYIQYPKDRRLN